MTTIVTQRSRSAVAFNVTHRLAIVAVGGATRGLGHTSRPYDSTQRACQQIPRRGFNNHTHASSVTVKLTMFSMPVLARSGNTGNTKSGRGFIPHC